MQNKRVIFIALFCLPIGLFALKAQETIAASGSNANGSGGTASYTVGQIVYGSSTDSKGSITEGVQQPFEIFVVTGIEQSKGVTLECSVYPNPTTNSLILKADENILKEKCVITLFDINGKLLKKKEIESYETTIDMSSYLPATYFLKINQNNIEIKTFKIVKN
jgi:hypothetical protein